MLNINLSNGMIVKMPAGTYVVQVWYSGCWNNDSAFIKKDDAINRFNKLHEEGEDYLRIQQFI